MRTHTVITIRLDDGCKSDPAGRLCQYDYGQRIQFVGVTLPASYEVHFSNQKQGKSVTMIGDETGVEIPDAVLLTGQDVHVWLYLHQGADDGETVYYARIAVENRAEPTHEEPTPVQQSEIEQAIAALNAAVETTGEAAATATAAAAAAEESQDAAEDAKDLAEAAAETAESAKDAAEASEDAAADSRDRAETAADAAETSAGTAEDAKTLAVAAQAAAEGSAGAAAGSATAASGAASTAGTYALKSEGYAIGKQNGEAVDSESPYYHGNAAYYAGEAGISAQTASGSATAAAGSANTASGAAGTATAAASTATAAKTAAESAQTGAVAAQTAAEAAQAAAESARDVLLNMIDDTAGAGDTTKVWSADKSSSVASGLLSAIDSKAPVILRDASGDIVTVTDGADGMPLAECVVSVTAVQEGTGDPSPENIRPISGVTASNIFRTGKNLLGGNALRDNAIAAIGGSEDYHDDRYVKFSSAGTIRKPIIDGNVFKPLTQYTFIIAFSKTSGTGSNLGVWYTDGTRDNIPAHSDADVTTKETVVLVTAANKSVAYFGKRNSSGWTILYYDESGIFEGVLTAADFESYQGQTYPVTFPTEAGSVYGGEVDMKAEKLTVNALATDMGSLSWTYNSDGTYPFFYAALPAPARRRATLTYGVSLCEIYKPVPNMTGAGFASEDHDHEICINSGYAGGYRVIVQDSSYTDADTFAAAVSGKLLIAPLASGVEYDLTDLPTITTLPGYNAIWSDTGTVAVTYPADTKTYVDDHTPVQDVQINGTSVLVDGVANVPVASASTLGVVKVAAGSYGISIRDSGDIQVEPSSDGLVKAGTETRKPLVPYRQHMSAFYGLAKAAGADMASSSNAVGTYTDEAKIAIQKMLGVYQAPWELIREDTFTNATEADHIITVDGNGQSFELTDVIFQFETPKQDTAASKGYYGIVWFYYTSSDSVTTESGAWTQAANANAKGFTAIIRNVDGFMISGATQSAEQGNNAAFRLRYTANFVASGGVLLRDMTFTKINIKSVTGTGHYKLYGKRKWN